MTPPNHKDIIREIVSRHPKPPPRRATPGDWTEPALAVHNLVVKGWGVTPSVRMVVDQIVPPDPVRAANGIRAAYYALLNKLAKRP